MAIAKLTATIFANSLAITLAVLDYGYWALIVLTLSNKILYTVIIWVKSKWKPSVVMDLKSLKSMYKFGYKLFLLRILDVFSNNIYNVIIGKKYFAVNLGYYTRSNNFFNIFIKQSTATFGKVIFSSFSQIQDDKKKIENGYDQSFRLLSFVLFPVVALLIVTSENFVRILLTEKWIGAVPFMQLMYIEGLFLPLFALNNQSFNAIGRSDVSLKIGIIKNILVVGSVLVTIQYSISALIIGKVISSFLAFLISMYFINLKICKWNARKMNDIYVVILLSLIIFIIDMTVMNYLLKNSLLLISAQLLFGLIFYIGTMRILNLKIYNEFTSFLKVLLPNKFRFQK